MYSELQMIGFATLVPKEEIYNVDIHIWRKPGMGNSLQTIVGNKISKYIIIERN